MLKTEVRKQLVILLIVFMLLFIGAIILISNDNLGLTGMAVTDAHSIAINKLYSSDSYLDLELATVPASISISGAVQGPGTIRVYADDGQSRSLIFDKQVLNLPTQLTEDELLDLQQFSSTCLDSCSHSFATNNIRLEIEVQDATLYIEDVTYSEFAQEPLQQPALEPEPTPEPAQQPEEQPPAPDQFDMQVQIEEPLPEQQPAQQPIKKIKFPNKVQSNERFFYGNERLFDKEAVKNIAFKTKDDPEFDVIFEDLIRTQSDVTIKYHHDSETSQPVAVIGITDYTLSTTNAAPGETIELTVPLVDFLLPEFTLRVGAQSEEFDFGGDFEAQTDVGACYTTVVDGEVVNLVSNLNGAGSGGPCVTVLHNNVNIVFNGFFITSSSPDDGLTFAAVYLNGVTGTNFVGPGLVEASGVNDPGIEMTAGTSNTAINDVDISCIDGNCIDAIGSITITGGSVIASGIGIPVSITGGATSFTFDGDDVTKDKIEGNSDNDLINAPAGSTFAFTDFIFDGNDVSEGLYLDGTITLTNGRIDETKPDDDSPPPPPARLRTGPIDLDNIQVSDNNVYLGNAIEIVEVSGGSGTDIITPKGQNGECGLLVVDSENVVFEGVTTDCAEIDPSFNITIENSTFANASNCILVADSTNNTLVNNNNISNCQVGVNITNASKHNVVKNNSIYNCSIGVGIYNGSWNNTVYYNNISNGTRTLFAFAEDLTGAGSNSFNTTVAGVPQGNLWGDIGLFDIFDTNNDGFGDAGIDYPYGLQPGGRTVGNVSGNVTDWGPMNPAGQSDCANITTNLSLYNNVTAQGDCFRINTSGVTFDCNGYTITSNGSGNGIYIVGGITDVLVKNCKVRNFSRGFYLVSSAYMNVTLQNNTVTNNSEGVTERNNVFNLTLVNNTMNNTDDLASFTDVALSLPYNNRIYFINQSIDTYDFTPGGLLNPGSAFFIVISPHGILRYTSMVGGSGGNLTNHMIVSNNSIFVNSTANSNLNKSANLTFYNISFVDPTPYYDINDNGTFVLCPPSICTEQSYVGTTYKYNVSHFTAFSSQEGVACGQTLTSDTNLTQNLSSQGTCFTIGANNITLDCKGYTVTGNGTGSGVFISNYNESRIENCTLRNFTDGVKIQTNSRDSTLIENTIDNCTRGTYLVDTVFNTTYINNTFSRCVNDIVAQKFSAVFLPLYETIYLIDQPIANYQLGTSGPLAPDSSRVNLSVENSSAGVLNFLAFFTGAAGSNLYGNSTSDIKIGTNNTFVNQTSQPQFNISANLTFYGISAADPDPFYDPEDDGTFTACPSNVCTEQSYVGTTYKYNVSHFTAFSSQDVAVACGQTITSNSTLQQNLNCNGTALIINTSGVAFDCDGYSITGNGSGIGIKIQNASNVNITNCTIANFVKDIDSDPAVGTIIENSIIENATTCILFNETNESIIRNNSLWNCTTHAIRFIDSYLNNVSNNYIEYVRRGIFLEETTASNRIINNTIYNYTSTTSTIPYAISVDGDNNTIENNTLLNGTASGFTRVVGIYVGYGEGSTKTSNDNVFRGNTITNVSSRSQSSTGIYIRGGSNNLIDLNQISIVYGKGMTIEQSYTTIINNTIFNSDGNGIIMHQPSRNNIRVANNTIHHIAGSIPFSAGIRLTDDNSYHNISDNRIYECTEGMLLGDEFLSTDDLLFHRIWNNEVFNNTQNGIHLYLSQDVLIENNTIYNNTLSGIVLNTTDSTNVTNNSVSGNSIHGINIVESPIGGGGPGTLDKIENNRVTGNTQNGINVIFSSQIIIKNNTATSNYHGIHVYNSISDTVILNTVNQNNVDGILINNSDDVRVQNNTANGNTLDGIGTYGVDNNTIEFNLAQNSGRGGIILEYTTNSFVFNNTASNNINNNGMELFRTNYTVMSGNTANLNGKDGIQLDEANNNNITFNTANSNQGTWAGPPPAGSGILLDNMAYFNLIHNNTLLANNAGGITIESSDNNTITNNTLNSNNIGVNVTGTSTGNIFYFNNFTGSKIVHAHADAVGNSFNRTNGAKAAGFTAEGNAWDDIQQWQIYDSNADGFADTGAQYPYGLQTDGITIYGNITGNVTDWGPMNANASPVPPSTQQVILNSTYLTNFTEESLNCYARIIDDNNLSITAFYNWYNNTVIVPGLSGSTVISNNTLSLVSTVSPSATHIGENWTCEVFGGDGTSNETSPLNSTNLTIKGCGNLGRSMTLIEDRDFGANCFNLTTDDIYLDCSNHLIKGQNISGTVAVSALSKDNATIRNCEIYNYTYGIQLNYTNNSFVFNNDVLNNSADQIFLYESDLNSVYNNTINGRFFWYVVGAWGSSKGRGITLINSDNNRLYDNLHKRRSTSFPYGGIADHLLLLINSNYNNLTNNTASRTNLAGFNLTSGSSFNRLIENHANRSGLAGFNLYGGANNNTLYNNTGNNNGLDLFRVETSHNNIIRNNSMRDDGLYGVHLILSNNNQILDNYIFQENEGILLNRSNFTLIRNNVGNSNYDYDYYLLYSFYNNIVNNTAIQSTSGGYYLDNSMYNNLTNNTQSNSWNHGVQVADKSHNNLFTNIRVSGSISFNGFDVYDSFNNTFSNCSLSSGTSWNGVELGNASGTVLKNITINPAGNHGFYFINSSSVDVLDSLVNGSGVKGIFLIDSDDVILTRTTSTSSSAEDLNVSLSNNLQFIDSFAQNYRFSQAGITFENTTHGKINFTTLLNQVQTDLMKDIAFSNKYIFVNSSNAPGLNVSADLTFYSLLFADPKPIVDFEDDGSFINCPASVCTEQSYTGTTYKYQVTHFTNYSAGESVSNVTVVKADSADPTTNGSVLTYTIAYNNNGETNVTNVTITDTYDLNVTFINSTPASDDPTVNNTWIIGNLSVNQSGTVTINVRVNSSMANNTNLTNFVNLTYQNSTGANLSTTDTEITLVQLTPPLAPPAAPPAPAGPTGGGGGGGSRSGYYSYQRAPAVEEEPVKPPTKVPRHAKPANITVEEKPKVEALPAAVEEEAVPGIIEEEKEVSFSFLWWLIPLLLLLILLLVLYEMRLHRLKEKVATRELATSFFARYGKKAPKTLRKPPRKIKPVKTKAKPKPKRIKKKKTIKAKPKIPTKELAAAFMTKYGKEKKPKKIKKKRAEKVKKKKFKPAKKKKPKKPRLGLMKRVKLKKFEKQGKNLGKLEEEMKDIGDEIDKLLKKKI
ncbi:DUF11 domain-containing protein [Candidatus Woesearchaeota archaeon]|nr:DUF11 domain-containing protein [Candidatus Woesearchaeota archaeon]